MYFHVYCVFSACFIFTPLLFYRSSDKNMMRHTVALVSVFYFLLPGVIPLLDCVPEKETEESESLHATLFFVIANIIHYFHKIPSSFHKATSPDVA